MTEIIRFISDRYDELQRLAEATTQVPVAGQWCATRDKHAAADTPLRLIQGRDPYEGEDWNDYEAGEYNGTPIIAFSAEWQDEAEANLRHIAYHDPARVLADIAAKRQMLRHLEVLRHDAEGAVAALPADAPLTVAAFVVFAVGAVAVQEKLLAAPFAGHPDFKPEWRIDG
jgi:hypothetical protein